jgi:ATP-dependent RNA helicase SUPV3L1/SUV3
MSLQTMASYAHSAIKAVLGPTNTGKTHLAIERMCGHSSGLMGFPLRLLAREVYDRVCRIKGADQVALLTGEERIVPANARYVMATAEAMPTRSGFGSFKDFAFVGVDEIQLAADPERGHIFTDRMLHARGREETMLLGSATMAPLVRKLVRDAEIISRPRFSTLRYAGSAKLSRLPKRSAIVAFSVEEVYRVAEMLRRHRGGAAVVMGALSPATRNAQVAMFEAGEVDYLVATDAIGMGLNLNVDHVAFASLRKYDGQRTRRLTVAEMAQIAGRAGRHQKDGTFGDIGASDGPPAFSAEEVERIEEHRFDAIEQIFWREADLPMDDIATLIEALTDRPDSPGLRAAPEAVDLAALKYLADLPDVIARARGPHQVARLWAACSVPDFQKLGLEHHARIIHRLWSWLSEGSGHIPQDWFAAQLARLDNVQGDVDALAGRIGAVRIWAYVAQRDDWLAQPVEMAARARALEDRLSDALHGALRQRFVDRRASALLRQGGGTNALLAVDVDSNGNVTVDGHKIGTMRGFRFAVDPTARASEKRLLLAAAERRLGAHLNEMAQALLAVDDKAFSLASPPGGDAQIIWNGHPVATLKAGQRLLAPELTLDSGLSSLVPEIQQGVRDRLGVWIKGQLDRHIPALLKMEAGATDPELPPSVRAVLAQLADAGGIMPRTALDEALGQVAKEDRTHLRKAGVVIGVMDLYHPGLMKPAAAQWRMALLSLKRAKPLVALPAAGAVLIPASEELDEIGASIAGFRKLGESWLRIDMAERLARGAHEAIAAGKPYGADDATIVSIGLNEAGFLDLMRQAGFRPVPDAAEGAPNWTFRGRPKARPPRPEGEQRRRRPQGDRPQGDRPQGDRPQGNRSAGNRPESERVQGERAGGERPPRGDRPERKAGGGGRPDRDRAPRDDRKGQPDRKPRPQDRDRDRGPREPRQIVATGKALAGLGALFGRED